MAGRVPVRVVGEVHIAAGLDLGLEVGGQVQEGDALRLAEVPHELIDGQAVTQQGWRAGRRLLVAQGEADGLTQLLCDRLASTSGR